MKHRVTITMLVDPSKYHQAPDNADGAKAVAVEILKGRADLPPGGYQIEATPLDPPRPRKQDPGPLKTLTDLSPMPWGKHAGVPMQDVPPSYLHWVWSKSKKDRRCSVIDYIRRNLGALKQEHPDGIW